MNQNSVAVLCFLEDCISPMRADVIAARLFLPVETVYACLVSLYDLGLARVARTGGKGSVISGWEAA